MPTIPTASQVVALPVFGGRPSVDPYPHMMWPASHFVPHANRFFRFTVEIDMTNLMSLGVRLEAALHTALEYRMGQAADFIIGEARMRLQPGHGYDTGLMYESLRRDLVEHMEQGMVVYDLHAPEAPYWVYVEFGHMTRGGSWWAGYHFLTGALLDNEKYVVSKANEAVRDAIMAVSASSIASARVL